YHVFDRLLGYEPLPWMDRLKPNDRKPDGEDGPNPGKDLPALDTRPSHPLDDLVGYYEHQGYGTIRETKSAVADELEVAFQDLRMPLRHFHYDVFQLGRPHSASALGNAKLQFTFDVDGHVEGLRVPPDSDSPQLFFARQPDPSWRTAGYLGPM